jgi:Leucine-rich repeat (LRR) protein
MRDVNKGKALLSSVFLEFCAKVRTNDPSILPEPGQPFQIRLLSEKEVIELADALLVNASVTYLQLETEMQGYTKKSAEAMAKYVRTSKRLQRIYWKGEWYLGLRRREEMVRCFLLAFQESTSLKELHMDSTSEGGPSNLALENMLTHTQSLQSLHLNFPVGSLEYKAVAAASAGLKRNTTLRELTLEFSRRYTTVSPLLTSLCDHPHLRRLCLHGSVGFLTGLETLLLSDTSKITELEFDLFHDHERPPMMFLTRILRALARRPTLTKLMMHCCPLGRDDARLLPMVLCNMPSLHTLVLTGDTLGDAGLRELAPALHNNTSIKVLDLTRNKLSDIESAEGLRDILRRNKTITTLQLTGNRFGHETGAVECIADGLGSNSTLLKINLSSCDLRDGGISTLAQILGSRNTTLQKLTLDQNLITSTGVGVLLEAMEQGSHHITDLSLRYNATIGNEGASLLARSLGNNALPYLTHLSLDSCGIDDDGFIALVSALEQNTSLLQLDLGNKTQAVRVSKRAFLALGESLPKIKVLQRVDLTWFPGCIASVMPILLAGLRKNTSLFRFHVADCETSSIPPSLIETARCAGSWMQEIERLGYRNFFLPFVSVPKERLPPLGVWPHALARVAILPDVIFEVLRSKPSLVSSEHIEGKEAAKDTGVTTKRKRGDE